MVKPLLNTYEITWKPDKNRLEKPYYESLARALKEDIVQGVLPAYTKLPPQRELARFLGLNLSTVTKAYKLCETNGLLTAAVGRGTFVAPLTLLSHPFVEGVLENDMSKEGQAFDSSLEKRQLINLAYQTVSSIHADVIREVGTEVLKDDCSSSLFENSSYLGTAFQIQAGKTWLSDLGVKLSNASSVFITTGIAHALGIVLSTFFQPGVAIALDTYTSPYSAATLSKFLHARMVPIDNDSEGMSATSLETACRTGKIKAVYVLPAGSPTNIIMSATRKAEIAAIARKYNLLVIEDDYLMPFEKTRTEPIYNLIPERTVYISSVSQAISVGVRIAYVVVPRTYEQAVAETLFASMYKLPPFDTEVAARVISQGLHRKLIAEKQERIRVRNWCFAAYFPYLSMRSSAIGQWIPVPVGLTGKQVEEDLRKQGIQVLSARHFALGERTHDMALYVSTCGPTSLNQLRVGLQKIKDYLELQSGGSLTTPSTD